LTGPSIQTSPTYSNSNMQSVFSVSFQAVLRLLLVALVGCVLGKTKVLTAEARRSLSKIMIWVMLPSLLIVSLSKEINVESLGTYAPILLSAPAVCLVGFLIGKLMAIIFRVPPHLRRLTIAGNTLGNASYIPLPLLATICATAPMFAQNPDQARTLSVTYISVYLLGHSPILWIFGYPYLSGCSWRTISWKHMASPPNCASIIGLSIGLIPPLRQLFIGSDAPLNVVMGALKLLSDGVFPCSLLILGANLADPPPRDEPIQWNAFAALITGRLLVLPFFGFALAGCLWHANLIPRDGLCALIIIVETAVPPATNLVIMSQMHQKGEAAMARLLIAAYACAVITLTTVIVFALKTIDAWL
jgi:predicted permease